MLRRKSICYILAGRQEVWLVFQGQVIQLEADAEIITPTAIVEKCSQWRCSKIVLFLEFPWIFLSFQAIIPLSRIDAIRYSRNILGFHSTNPEKFSKIGICFFELPEKNKKGLLCASLPPQTIQLQEAFQKSQRVKVELVPLLYACIPELLRDQSQSILFHGMNQVALIEKQKNLLQKITLLPEPTAKESNEKIIEDYLNVPVTKIQSLHLSKNSPEKINSATHLSIFSIVQQWKGIAKNANYPFWWETREIAWQTNWKWVGVLGWVGVMLGLIGWNFIAIESNQKLRQQLNQSLQKIKEDQTKILQFKAYTAQQERFIQVETIYEHLNDSSVIAKRMLKQLITPLNSRVWVDKLSYAEHRVELNLLALETSLIPQVLDQLADVPMVKEVLLKSQQMTELNQQDITKFILQVDLKVEYEKAPQRENVTRIVE